MEVLLPASFPVSLTAAVLIIGTIAGAVKAYMALKTQINHLEEKFDHMIARNQRADKETEAVKMEQSEQRLSVALMAQQMAAYGETLSKIDKKLDGIIQFNMTGGHYRRENDK